MDDQLGGFKVVKLNDDNFYVWKQRIELVLAYRELDDLITDDPPPASDDGFKAWKKSDARARAVIGLSLSDEHLEHVREVKTAKEMWNCILNVFERHSLLNKLAARRNFYTVTMKEGEKMLTYINRVRQLATALRSMNAQVDDAEAAMAILHGLPDQYSGLIVALDALGDDKSFTVDLVKSKLLQEEQRIKARLEESTSEVKSEASALVNNGKRVYKRNNKAYTVLKCDYCEKSGHNSKYCWERLAHAKAQNRVATQRAAIAGQADQTESENEEDVVCLMAKECFSPSSQEMNQSGKWIIDSGASSHMTFNTSSFTEDTPIQPFDVELGDKYKAPAVGKGKVSLNIHVKGKNKICILSNVLHVPKLGYNLISVSTMDTMGMQTLFSGGKCQIMMNGCVLAEGVRKRGLYTLNLARNDRFHGNGCRSKCCKFAAMACAFGSCAF